jgi:hypothetical protein
VTPADHLSAAARSSCSYDTRAASTMRETAPISATATRSNSNQPARSGTPCSSRWRDDGPLSQTSPKMKNVERDLGGKFLVWKSVETSGRHVGGCDAARSRRPGHHQNRGQHSQPKNGTPRSTKYKNITHCNQPRRKPTLRDFGLLAMA